MDWEKKVPCMKERYSVCGWREEVKSGLYWGIRVRLIKFISAREDMFTYILCNFWYSDYATNRSVLLAQQKRHG